MWDSLKQLAVDTARGILALIFLVSVAVTLLSWGLSGTGAWWRYGSPVAAIVSLIGLSRCVHKDKLPDFLSKVVRRRFDKNGLSFAPVLAVNDGLCWLVMYFQNKYERPCKADVRLQPSIGFILGKSAIPPLSIPIESGPAAFGAVFVPWGIPREYQGTKQKFDVTAVVQYPAGRGRMLRFGQGFAVGDHASRQSNSSYLGSILLALCGHLHISVSEPAHTTMELPGSVAETLPEKAEVTQQVFWQLGDEVLDPDAGNIFGSIDGRSPRANG